MIKKIVIDNSKSSARSTDHWDPDRRGLIKSALESTTPTTLVNEIFLESDDKDKFNPSKCKYPHHEIVDGKCVLNIEGVKAAYARAKQQNIKNEKFWEHIDRHRKELGMIEDEQKMESFERSISRAFRLIQEAMDQPEPMEQKSDNLFDLMIEKPQVTPAQNGTPITADLNVGQQIPQQSDPNIPADSSQQQYQGNQPSTIPVANVDPTEDTLTNNPVEGPDDRDQDNLDGIQRKEMYQRFADVMTNANKNNVFGTIFDQDIFKSEYKIVPYEMRYFYRLQNPVSVENGDLRFIPFGTELLEAQDKYQLGKKMFVFATSNDKPIFFNMLDKTIWFNDDKVGDNFDSFIESLTQNNGELIIDNENDEENNQDAVINYQQDPSTDNQDQLTGNQNTDEMQPIDLNQGSSQLPIGEVNNGFDQTSQPIDLQNTSTTNGVQPVTQQDSMNPVDLTQQNASVEYDDSILSFFSEDIDDIDPDVYKNITIFKRKYHYIPVTIDDWNLGIIKYKGYEILADINIDKDTMFASRVKNQHRICCSSVGRVPGPNDEPDIMPYVALDKFFFELPQKYEDHILLHEFGHLLVQFQPSTDEGIKARAMVLKKLEKFELPGARFDNVNIFEFEADAYAIANGDKETFKKAMQSYVDKLKKANPADASKMDKDLAQRLLAADSLTKNDLEVYTNITSNGMIGNGFSDKNNKNNREKIKEQIAKSKNESIDDTSIIDEMFAESVAFPNDELDTLNRKRAAERERRKRGEYLAE